MKVVFIAGGAWQKPFVKYLKDKGHFVAVVNPVVTETTLLADLHIKSDVNDLDKINNAIDEIKPSFITSDQSDISTLTVARLSEKWNLPGNSVEVIDKLTNKYSIYKLAKDIGVSVPETKLVNNIEDIHEFARLYGFPIAMKPTDATNSRGFRRIDSYQEITESLFQDSLRFSKSKQVIVQKFVYGYMITLEGICSGNQHRTIASSKKNSFLKPGINSDVQYPSCLPNELLDRIIVDNDRYVESAQMKFGLTHSEYIIDGDSYYLIEIGGRGGGAGITDKIVPWVSGIQSYDILYASLLGQVVDVKSLVALQRPALLKYYREEDVLNCTKQKAELIRKIPGVADFQFNFIGQQYVKDANDIRHSMGIYLADSEDEIKEIEQQIQAALNEC